MARSRDIGWVAAAVMAGMLWSWPAAGQENQPDAVQSAQEQLLASLQEQLADPGADPGGVADGEAVKGRLRELVRVASLLELTTSPGPLKLQAVSLQMQGLYALMVRWPEDEQADRWSQRLRSAARRAKALIEPEAKSIGDFWLMTADLYEINRSDLPLAERQEQASELMAGYVRKHPEGPASAEVKAALAELAAAMAAGQERDASRPYTVSEARVDASGVAHYLVTSEFQSKAVELRVWPPRVLEPGRKYAVLYVLPTEPGLGGQQGDALRAMRGHRVHEERDWIIVMPSFARAVWMGDHPTDPTMRNESFFMQAVVPAVDERYPTDGARRLLLGFGRSGYGAVSLLLRHPDKFAAAAAWDAPLMEQTPANHGMAAVYGSQEHFERYQVSRLLEGGAASLVNGPRRIALLGYDSFRGQMQAAHQLLDRLNVPHIYADGPPRRHHWDGGWVPEAIGALGEMAP